MSNIRANTLHAVTLSANNFSADVSGANSFSSNTANIVALSSNTANVTTITANTLVSNTGTFTTIFSPHSLVAQGRLTLESGVPVSTTDQLAKGTIYYTPYLGNAISLYDGTHWKTMTFSEISLALTATSGKPYDVFAYDNAGTVAIETLVWTNDTTRATALVRQDGVLCKTGALTRRYIGTIYASTTNQCEDSDAKRFVWNMYNRVPRSMSAVEAAVTWTYASVTIRQVNANAANQLEFVRGLDEGLVYADASFVTDLAVSGVANDQVSSYIGLDSTTTQATGTLAGRTRTIDLNDQNIVSAKYVGYPGVGKHRLTFLENRLGGTGTYRGFGALGNGGTAGIFGTMEI